MNKFSDIHPEENKLINIIWSDEKNTQEYWKEGIYYFDVNPVPVSWNYSTIETGQFYDHQFDAIRIKIINEGSVWHNIKTWDFEVVWGSELLGGIKKDNILECTLLNFFVLVDEK